LRLFAKGVPDGRITIQPSFQCKEDLSRPCAFCSALACKMFSDEFLLFLGPPISSSPGVSSPKGECIICRYVWLFSFSLVTVPPLLPRAHRIIRWHRAASEVSPFRLSFLMLLSPLKPMLSLAPRFSGRAIQSLPPAPQEDKACL